MIPLFAISDRGSQHRQKTGQKGKVENNKRCLFEHHSSTAAKVDGIERGGRMRHQPMILFDGRSSTGQQRYTVG